MVLLKNEAQGYVQIVLIVLFNLSKGSH